MAKSSKSKGAGKRQPRPKSDAIANIMRPHKHDEVLAIAEKLQSGDDIGIGVINGALMSQDEVAAEFKAYNDAMDKYNEACDEAAASGKDEPALPAFPSITPVYDPVIAEAINRLNCRVAMQGQASKHTKEPADWKSNLGTWKEGRYIDDAGVRMNHIRDLTRNVIDPEANLVKLGTWTFLIGDDTTSAILNASPSKSGNYAANLLAAKRLSLADAKGLSNIVARFNNAITTLNLDDGTKPGGCIHFLPNQLATWGYLERDGRRLNYSQIRKAAEAGETGIKFVELEEPIVGESFGKTKFYSTVQKVMALAATRDEAGKTAWDRYEQRGEKAKGANNELNVWRNLFVQMRVSPSVWMCFGFENLQWGITPVSHFGDSLDEQLVRLVVGVRLGTDYAESRPMARLRIQPEPKAKAPKAPKAEKAAKPKTEKKKAEKPKRTTKKAEDGNAADKPKKPRKTKEPKTIDTPAPQVVEEVVEDALPPISEFGGGMPREEVVETANESLAS